MFMVFYSHFFFSLPVKILNRNIFSYRKQQSIKFISLLLECITCHIINYTISLMYRLKILLYSFPWCIALKHSLLLQNYLIVYGGNTTYTFQDRNGLIITIWLLIFKLYIMYLTRVETCSLPRFVRISTSCFLLWIPYNFTCPIFWSTYNHYLALCFHRGLDVWNDFLSEIF